MRLWVAAEKLDLNLWPVVVTVRLNERLKEAAMSRLSADDVGPAEDDEAGAINNLRQQLTLAIHVGKVL